MGQCFVIGIHGPWGDGKTTVLNFVAKLLESDTSAVVTSYNPWRFVSEEVMLAGFFGTLAAAVRLQLKTGGERLAGVLAKYGKLVAPADDRAAKVADIASSKSEVSLEELRRRLRSGLLRAAKRVVVFIDDLDRLEANEIAALLRIIKACADFPNVVYVLAFDREMVAATIGQTLGGGGIEAGRRFLEKIVQIPLTMPPAASVDLDRACKLGIAAVLDAHRLELSDPEILRWNWAFQNGISRRLRTPRNVGQYLNAVRFAVPLLAREVNTVDLLLVEALRVCYPVAYEVIRSNQRIFAGVPSGDVERRHGQSPQEDLFTSAKEGLDLRTGDALDALVEGLFPRYHVARRGFILGPESTRGWTREKRVCSPAYCARFFSYAIGSSDVADRQIDGILEAATGSEAALAHPRLDSQLLPLKQAVLIAKLDQRRAELTPSAASRLAVAISSLSERFEEPFSLQDLNHTGIAAASLVSDLCRQVVSPDERLSAALAVVNNAPDLWFVAAFMREADYPFPSNDRKTILDDSKLQPLRQAFTRRFDEFDRTGTTLLDLERRWRFEMLFSVAQSAGREKVNQRFVPQMASNGSLAIRLLQCVAQPVWRSGEIIPSPGDLEVEDLNTLAYLVDVDEMAKVVFPNWIREERQKGPGEWDKLSPDDRILAQFWFLYTNRNNSTAQK